MALLVFSLSCRQSPDAYVAKGNDLFKAGKYDEAILNYRKAIQKDARSGEAHYRIALAELKTGNNREAYGALLTARGLLPERRDVRVTLGDLLLLAYMNDKTRPAAVYQQLNSVSDELLSADPNSYDGLRIKGNLAWSDGQLKAAQQYFEKANRIKPMQPDLILSWTQVLFKDGQQVEGERLAKELIQNRKKAPGVYDLLVQHYRSENRMNDAEETRRIEVANNPGEIDYVLQLGSFYAAAGKRDEMSKVLKGLLDDSKAYPDARLKVGDFYAALHEWPESLQLYEEGAKLDPKNRVAYLKRITDAWLAQGEGEKAAAVVGEIVKEHSDDNAAKAVNATLLLNTGRPEKMEAGIKDLEEVSKKDPDNPVFHFALGHALAAKGDMDGAKAQFQESVQRRPDYLPSILAMAEISQRRAEYGQSLQYANQALSINPRLGRARLLRVTAFMGTHNYAQARPELANLAREFPQDTEVQFQTASLDIAEKKNQEAEAILEKLYQKDRVRALAGLEQAYRAEGRADKALSRLTTEVGKSGESTGLRVLLAETATRSGKYDVALEQYKYLLAQRQNAQLQIRLGGVYQLKGDLKSALESYQTAKDLAPRDPVAVGALADAFRMAGRNAEALVNYQKLLQLQPDNAIAMNNVAFLLLENGSGVDEAQRLAERAVQKSPQDPNFADTLGMVYMRRNLGDSAMQVFGGLVHRFPDNPEYHFHYGLALTQRGDKSKARNEFQMALRKSPSDDLRKSIQSTLAKIQ